MGEVVQLQEQATFDDFWALYPKRVARKDAERAWRKIDAAIYPHILERLYHWRRAWLERGELQYVPHAATWLNGERWEDELPSAAHASHVQAKPPERGDKTAMPQYVKDMIHQLRRR